MQDDKQTSDEPSNEQAIITVDTPAQEPAPNKDAEHNFAAIREVAKLQKQTIEDKERTIQELKERLQSLSAPKQEKEVDEFDSLDPDEYITIARAKVLRDSAKKQAVREAEEAARKLVQEHLFQQQVERDEREMRQKHDDFDYVVENFAIPMLKSDPALAYRVQTSKNPAEVAYKLAKVSAEYESSVSKKEASAKAEKVLRNVSRPASSSSASAPVKGQGNDYSHMSKEDIWKLSQQHARGA